MIKIIIIEEADGGMRCSATEDISKNGQAATKVVGMLEIAKASLLQGRWGVIDSEGMLNAYPAVFEQYREALLQSTMTALAIGKQKP